MKKIFIIFFTLILCFCLISCEQGDNITDHKIKYEEKTKFKLMSLEQDNTIDENKTEDENIVITLHVDVTPLNEQSLKESDYDAYLNKAKEHYTTQNQNAISNMNLTEYDSYYVSKFAPFVEYTYSYNKFIELKSQIETIINQTTKIANAYVKGYAKDGSQNEEYVFSALCSDGVNASDEYRNRTVTGKGVRIGILETGEVDFDHSELKNVTHETYKKFLRPAGISTHATQMARIIGGEYGIACDAELYSSSIIGSMVDEIDWMIEKNVNILNMSFGIGEENGIYNDDSAYIDHIANNYNILFVAASGNTGLEDAYVANPGLAYNAITVGSSINNNDRWSFSSYKVQKGGHKPTLITPSSVMLHDSLDFISGTSISTAIMSGVAALLCEKFPNLKASQRALTSLVVANAEKYEGFNYNLSSKLDDEIGAGELDYGSCVDQVRRCFDEFNGENLSNAFVYSKRIALFRDTTFDLALVWQAVSDGKAENVKISDYDVRLYDENDKVIAIGYSTKNNIETLRYINTTEDIKIVTIKVYLYGEAVIDKENFSVAYRVFDI